MLIPATVLSAVIWLAVAAIIVGAGYLLILLVREWRSGDLW